MRLIDADALYNFFLEMHKSGNTCDPQDVLKAITNAPTVQREGWVSVPIEPTEEMLRAGCEAGLDFKTLMDDTPYSTDLAVYKAMLQAAPDKE